MEWVKARVYAGGDAGRASERPRTSSKDLIAMPCDERVRRMMVPLHRSGRQDDAAGLVQFLSSRAGSYLTGITIPLDGGITGCG